VAPRAAHALRGRVLQVDGCPSSPLHYEADLRGILIRQRFVRKPTSSPKRQQTTGNVHADQSGCRHDSAGQRSRPIRSPATSNRCTSAGRSCRPQSELRKMIDSCISDVERAVAWPPPQPVLFERGRE
jgi:hypothetical protein